MYRMQPHEYLESDNEDMYVKDKHVKKDHFKKLCKSISHDNILDVLK